MGIFVPMAASLAFTLFFIHESSDASNKRLFWYALTPAAAIIGYKLLFSASKPFVAFVVGASVFVLVFAACALIRRKGWFYTPYR